MDSKSKKTYVCLRCEHKYNNKYNFNLHLQRKKPCKITFKNIDIDILLEKLHTNSYISYYNELSQTHQCQICSKVYSSKSNLLKHIKKCSSENEHNNSNKIIEKNIIQNITNNITNNIVNININSLGNEDLSDIDYNKLYFILDKNEYNQMSLLNKSNNHYHNLRIILNDLYSNPINQNFKLMNKRKQKYKVKIDEDDYQMKHINDLLNNINDIIINIYENFLDNNQEKLQHYIDHLNEQYKQLQKYKENKNEQGKEYYMINNKIQKCLKRTIQWIAENN